MDPPQLGTDLALVLVLVLVASCFIIVIRCLHSGRKNIGQLFPPSPLGCQSSQLPVWPRPSLLDVVNQSRLRLLLGWVGPLRRWGSAGVGLRLPPTHSAGRLAANDANHDHPTHMLFIPATRRRRKPEGDVSTYMPQFHLVMPIRFV